MHQAFALHSRLPHPMDGSRPTVDELRGLHRYLYVAEDGLQLECFLDCQAEEAATNDCPGIFACVNLTYALFHGVNFSNVLGADLVSEIEELALEFMIAAAEDVGCEV